MFFHQIWAGPLSDYRVAVILLNKYSDRHAVMSAEWEDIGLDPSTVVEARDLWEVIIHDLISNSALFLLDTDANICSFPMYAARDIGKPIRGEIDCDC